MSDPIAASRLGDLPNVGYSGTRAKETSDAIMFFMRNLERNRPLLLSIVVDGLDKWLKVTSSVWRGLLIDRELLTRTFQYLVQQAGPNPAQQLLILHGQMQQAEREQWDGRRRTREEAEKALRNSLADLKHSQKRVKGKQWFS